MITLVPPIYPSQLAEVYIHVMGEPFRFKGREYLEEIYDVEDRELLLMSGRQTEKSTTIGNKLILYAFVYSGVRILYISPSDTQTKTFSLERIRHPLLTSPMLRPYVDPRNMSVYNPKFGKDPRSLSIIKLRSAYLTADRVRGERADILGMDEYQDLLVENIPVIRSCMFHGNIEWRRILYSGTAKTLGNPIERLWLRSTMTELMFPCRRHGESNKPHTWYWFHITESCIGKFGLICPKCGGQIDHLDPMATWVDLGQKRDRQVRGYHISQPITPMAHEVSVEGRRAWDDILSNRENYPRGKFMNEVMGVSYDYGTQPLCEADLASCQVSDWLMEPTQLMEMMTLSGSNAIYAGIDWSGEEYAYTVVTLGTYARSPSADRLFQFYWHRFEGKEDDREIQLERIYDLLRVYNVKYVVADYGMGHYQNTWLANRLGPHRYVIMQYVGKQVKKVRWNPNLQRLTAYKSAVCSDYINAIKSGKIAFPAWSVFSQPCGGDFLNLRGEYVDKRDETMYVHGSESPVDAFHAGLYCLYASVIDHPRPDITRITFDEDEADAHDASALGPMYR